MTESRVLWLALGIFVGFMLWGEAKKRGLVAEAGTSVNPNSPIDGEPLTSRPNANGLPPACGGC